MNKREANEIRVTRHRVSETLQERILAGSYATGTRLVQQQLAREFGVSQAVVRESLFELKAFGLVEMTDRLGARVSAVHLRKLIEASDVREVLEGLAARLCCEHASRSGIRELEALAGRVDGLAREGRIQEAAVLDREFHRRVVELSGSEMLARLTESYVTLGKVVWMDRGEEPLRLDHAALVEPIRENRPEEAERRMREHVREAKAHLERQAAEGQFEPKWIEQ